MKKFLIKIGCILLVIAVARLIEYFSGIPYETSILNYLIVATICKELDRHD